MNRNLDYWDKYGEYLIPVMPFMDHVIERSEGNYLIDVEGRKILDLASGQFCSILGHNHAEFVKAIIKELENNLHLGSQYVSKTVLEAAKLVVEKAPPSLNHVIFLSTGSEANEFAMRVAKAYSKKNGMIGFDRGYYGITLGTRSLSSISSGVKHVDFTPKITECYNIIAPNCARCPLQLQYPGCEFACLELSKRLIGDYLENVAAIIIETIISAGGMIFPTPEYVKNIRKFADDIGALLIIDEAQTGFGRCGKWFDCENLDVIPDILVFSKTSGNGFPSSGVIINDRIQNKLTSEGFYHLSSHQNDPLTCSAVKSVINILEKENLIDNANAMGKYFMEALNNLKDKYGNIDHIRGRGLMLSFDLVEDTINKQPHYNMINPFVLACLEKGVHLTYTYFEQSIRILPGLTIEKNDIDYAISVIDEVLHKIKNNNLDINANLPKNKVTSKLFRNDKFLRIGRKIWEKSPKELVKIIKSKM